MNRSKLNKKTGFTLIELSISMLVISLLMAGVFSMATGSVVTSKTLATKQKLDTIYEALGTFLAVNKRLPCPASITELKVESANFGNEVRTASGCIGAGVYRSTTNSDLFFGGIPTRALNLSSDFAEDAFGNKFSYFIDQRFTFDFIPAPIPNMSVASFGTANATGVMTINERQASGSLLTLTNDAIIVIVSHGPNLSGGFSANNSIQNGDGTSETDQNDNRASGFNNTPSPPTGVFNNIFVSSSATSDVFDDMLFYKTRLDFVSDFSLANLIPCNASLITDPDFVARSLYYNQYLYATSACVSNNQFIKIAKCSFSGEWQYVVPSCPS